MSMEIFASAGYVVEYDHDATTAAYAAVLKGGADECACDSCHNFTCLRERTYPEEFLALLRSLGIDPLKENEVFECGKDERGLYQYGGWFHFVGKLVQVSFGMEVDGFRYWFVPARASPSPDEAFRRGPVSVIEFRTFLPWVSDKPESDDIPKRPIGFRRRVGGLLYFLWRNCWLPQQGVLTLFPRPRGGRAGRS